MSLPLAFISGGEGIVIFFAILMLFGAKKLPELARGLGSAVREFSKAKDEVERELTRPPMIQEPRVEQPVDVYPHAATAEVHPAVEVDPHTAARSVAAAPISTAAPVTEPQTVPPPASSQHPTV